MEMESTTLWVIVGAVVVMAAVGALLFFRSRPPKEEPTYYFRCPSCKRRLRYLARQAGHKGMCSNCKEPLNFPPPSAANR